MRTKGSPVEHGNGICANRGPVVGEQEGAQRFADLDDVLQIGGVDRVVATQQGLVLEPSTKPAHSGEFVPALVDIAGVHKILDEAQTARSGRSLGSTPGAPSHGRGF